MSNQVEMHTDGACRGNPGPGGWAAVLACAGQEQTVTGADLDTTNNRMELMAAIGGLESLDRHSLVRLVTDSTYVKNGITQWLPNWKRRGWKTASNTPVKNADLWIRLERVALRHDVEWVWVKGHAGNPGNERADCLARLAMEGLTRDEV